MNTLTKNRILEAGDEYYDGKVWKPIPTVDYGMQIMFTKYEQVRRPKEEPPKGILDDEPCNTLIPKDAYNVEPEKGTAPTPTPIAANTAKAALPEPKTLLGKIHRAVKLADFPPSAIKPLYSPAPPTTANGHKRVPYTDLSSMPNWIGRNGTFRARAINLYRTKNGLIKIIPEGTRGQAKNALIELPVADLPQIIDWLLQQQLESTLTK